MKKLMIISMALAVSGAVFAEDMTAQREAAAALQHDGQHAMAAQAFEQFLVDYPDAPDEVVVDVLSRLARSLIAQSGRRDDAKATAERLLSDFPDAPVNTRAGAYMVIGRVLRAQGQLDAALHTFETALLTVPDMVTRTRIDIQRHQVAIYIQQERFQEALAIMLLPEVKRESLVTDYKRLMAQAVIRPAKRQLFREGAPIAGTAGSAAIEARIAPVIAALNAPMFNGLEAALRGIGVDVPDQDRSPFDSFAGVLWERVMDLDADPADGDVSATVALYLGVDEWNAFVERYNFGVAE